MAIAAILQAIPVKMSSWSACSVQFISICIFCPIHGPNISVFEVSLTKFTGTSFRFPKNTSLRSDAFWALVGPYRTHHYIHKRFHRPKFGQLWILKLSHQTSEENDTSKRQAFGPSTTTPSNRKYFTM